MPGGLAESPPGAILGISVGGSMHVDQVREQLARTFGVDVRHVRMTVTFDADNGMIVDATILIPGGPPVETR